MRCSTWMTLVMLMTGALAPGAERLMWHEVRLDGNGKLLSWVEDNGPYGRIVRNAWEVFKNIPVREIAYVTFDPRSREVLRLRREPVKVLAGTVSLVRAKVLGRGQEGLSVAPVSQGGFVVRIEHHRSAGIAIQR